MESADLEFLNLAVVEQKKYSEIEEIMKLDRKTISELWNRLTEKREEISDIRKIWVNKTSSIDCFWDFYDWYKNTIPKCHYCGITEKYISILLQKDQIKTKRITTRGKKLEIERILPNESYQNISNLVFCCYWCNNAKTDEFSESEFHPIGNHIAQIWKSRLNS
jgi:hypothetical protein